MKYFFGYYITNGKVHSYKWVEDNGTSVGYNPPAVPGNRHEITKFNYQKIQLKYLEREFPYKPPQEETKPPD